MDVNGIIQRLRHVYAVKNDSELCVTLNLSKSATSNWRHRNAPPVDICFETARKKGISMDWLLFGIGQMSLGLTAASSASPHSELSTAWPAVERICAFVGLWGIHRSHDEMVWLEQQLRRAVPEYARWLANPASLAET